MALTEPGAGYRRLAPHAGELIASLRAFGYTPTTALADLIDNSIGAGARHVRIAHSSDPGNAWVAVIDDGHGLDEQALQSAMRFARNSGARRCGSDLGRFGLGLKTASLSQARRLTVLSRGNDGMLVGATWDIDHVMQHREWFLLTGVDEESQEIAELVGFGGQGTMILWRNLDRIGEGVVLSRELTSAGRELSLLFHRFLETGRLSIDVSGRRLQATDPYLRGHPATQDRGFEDLRHGDHRIRVNPVVLPHPLLLTSGERKCSSGTGGLLNRQGFYVYRGDRLVVAGDWLGIDGMTRSAGTRLARLALELSSESDTDWEIDVMKSSVRPPPPFMKRLTELAQDVRKRSERVFTHRGTHLAVPWDQQDIQPVWSSTVQRGSVQYTVNRRHPLLAAALAGAQSDTFEQVLRLIELTLPMRTVAQQAGSENSKKVATQDQAVAIDREVSVLRGILSSLPEDLEVRTRIVENLAAAEPFIRHPGLLREFNQSTFEED
ncbi:ATP-binding protein [Nocardiopsis deserti]|uniref:ATP-binding protein n=1 Tax=Nocardiopsis deserti TaxID=2605988 RepID=UPI001239DF85|nr:ATP-binding protein [Nocardiopsis deserti]